MNKLKDVAPCSLCCYTCPSYKNGVIKQSIDNLVKYYDGYPEFLHQNLPRKYKKYAKKTEKFVEYIQNEHASCGGCRGEKNRNCCIANCFILDCTKQHGIDFCGECENFPCDKAKTFFKGIVLDDYLKGNERIKKVGKEKFAEEITLKSHYASYKSNGK